MKHVLIFILSIASLSCIAQSAEKKIDSLIIRSEYSAAIQLINSQKEKSTLLQNKEAEALILSGKLNEGETILSKIKSDDPFIKAITLNNLGLLYLVRGRNDLALENMDRA